jgi:hypothetical protein
MSVTIQSGSIVEYVGAVGPSPLSQDLSVVVSSGSNLAIYLLVGLFGGGDDGTWNTPTLDGVPMTAVRNSSFAQNTNTYVYRILAPSPGTRTLQVSVSAWTGWGAKFMAFCAENVDQTTPDTTPVTSADSNQFSPMSVTLACPAGGILVGGAGVYGDGQLTASVSPEVDFAARSSASSRDLLHFYKVNANDLSVTFTNGNTQATLVGFAINPASASTPSDALRCKFPFSILNH